MDDDILIAHEVAVNIAMNVGDTAVVLYDICAQRDIPMIEYGNQKMHFYY